MSFLHKTMFVSLKQEEYQAGNKQDVEDKKEDNWCIESVVRGGVTTDSREGIVHTTLVRKIDAMQEVQSTTNDL